MQIDTAHYLNLTAPATRLRATLDIDVAAHAFVPGVDDLSSDWVATVATPAFRLIAQRQGAQTAFCSIGTGAGLDALAAAETLGATRIGITDVHVDVVETAARNIRANLLAPDTVRIEAGCGDLLDPLPPGACYDLIYENLPNIPAEDAAQVARARNSASQIAPRAESIPPLMRQNLLTLHYLALCKARDRLTPGGAVLSLIGGRIPLAVFHQMGRLAGWQTQILIYGWKVQTDPGDIISGHVQQQAQGYGPYRFYRASRLAQAFAGVALEQSGQQAEAIERSLLPDALSPEQALTAWRLGETIGHPVVALRSTPL